MSNDDVLVPRELLKALVGIASVAAPDSIDSVNQIQTVEDARALLDPPDRPHRFYVRKYRMQGRWLWEWTCGDDCPLHDGGYTTKVGAVRAGETRHSIQGLLARAA